MPETRHRFTLLRMIFAIAITCVQLLLAQDAQKLETQTSSTQSAQNESQNTPPKMMEYTIASGTVMRVSTDAPWKPRQLKSGSEIDGALLYSVYVLDREVIPAGSHVHVVVERVGKENDKQKKGIVEKLETVQHFGLGNPYHYNLIFRSAELAMPDATIIPLQLSCVRAGEVVMLHANGDEIKVTDTSGPSVAKSLPGVGKVEEAKDTKKKWEQLRHPVLTVKLEQPLLFSLPAPVDAAQAVSSEESATTVASTGEPEPNKPAIVIPSGTHARLLLLTEISSMENHAGDVFQARLEEPIKADGKTLLPSGTVFDGLIKKMDMPKRLSRAASLYLTFNKFTLPNGTSQPVTAMLDAADVGKKVPMTMDEEGGLHGKRREKMKVLGDIVLGTATADLVDEAVETATHVIAPYVGVGVGALILLGRHGNDVTLPQYSELDIVFNRPVNVPSENHTTTMK